MTGFLSRLNRQESSPITFDLVQSVRRTMDRLMAERRDFATSLETTMHVISAEMNGMQKSGGGFSDECMIYTFSVDVRICGNQLLSENNLEEDNPLSRLASGIFLLDQNPNYWNPVYRKPYFRITPDEVYRELRKFRRKDPMAVLSTYVH